ncbi:septal ring lytic transglycosylase RlpA family protein [Rhizobium rhizosphaerae]|uniref:septal ring lytic transglycosylase RlpA family protein n=1 Tax=Xaviernesmea rhizosphaerae TaxID=1672749 RepID=UPI00098FC2AD|nr:septal ring lytic transglycosylase RlpA family protein [Xaviernesmea rhizosphaerae]
MGTGRVTAAVIKGGRAAAIPLLCIGLASCGTTQKVAEAPPKQKRSKEYFPESVYGVKASPRVATGKNVPKGGGRYQVGDAYQVKGKWYQPKEEPGYDKVGMTSWYGSAFHGRLTANGEVYDTYHLSAAHPTFPLPSYARVTNLENGSSVVVRVNDRGPYEYNRLIDLSSKAADLLDVKRKGSAKVRVQYVGKAPLEGNDMPFLMASYVPKGDRTPHSLPGGGQIASGVMVASSASMREEVGSFGGSLFRHTSPEPRVVTGPTVRETPRAAAPAVAEHKAAKPVAAPAKTVAAPVMAAAVPAPAPVSVSARMADPRPQPRMPARMPAHAPDAPPSMLGAGIPLSALAEEDAPAQHAAPASFDAFFSLPQIGPMPTPRPGGAPRLASRSSFTAAYAEAPRPHPSEAAFEAILADGGELTAEKIILHADNAAAHR